MNMQKQIHYEHDPIDPHFPKRQKVFKTTSPVFEDCQDLILFRNITM